MSCTQKCILRWTASAKSILLPKNIVDAEGILVSLTKYLTLFPGDVVSLGRISTLLEVPADIVAKDGIHGTAGIEGLGELPFHFVKDTEAEEAETVREGF